MATAPIDIYKLKKLRPLGALEQFSSARHHLGFMLNVGCTATYISPSPILLAALKPLIFSALATVIDQHPILSAIIIDENSTAPYFARLPSIDLSSAVTFLTRAAKRAADDWSRDEELDNLLVSQHNRNFTADCYGSLPFWRVVVLLNPGEEREFVLAFIYHHALGDGGSGMVFHKHFLAALSSASITPLSIQKDTVIKPPKETLLPSLETLHPVPISTLTSDSAPRASPPPPNFFGGNPISLPCTTRFHTLCFPPRTASALLSACRTHTTTLTALLPALLASVLFRHLPSTYTSLTCMIPINIRRFLPQATAHADAFGVWIDGISTSYSRPAFASPSPFVWDEAHKTRQCIVDYLKTNGTALNVSAYLAVPNIPAFFASLLSQPRSTSIDCSNIGSFSPSPSSLSTGKGADPKEDAENGSCWEIGKMIFGRSAFASGSAISTGVVSGGDGSLSIGFGWQEGVVEDELVESLIEGVRGEIEGIALEV